MSEFDPALHNIDVIQTNKNDVAIVMRLPINDQTRQWVGSYCYEQPFEIYKKTNSKSNFEDYIQHALQKIPVETKKSETGNDYFEITYHPGKQKEAGVVRQVPLPYLTENTRGLSPEPMLKTMRELVDRELTGQKSLFLVDSLRILNAGAKYDSLIKDCLNNKPINFFLVASEVLDNVDLTKTTINENQENPLLEKARIRLINILDAPNSSNFALIAANIAIGAVYLMKWGVNGTEKFLESLFNPTKTIQNILADNSALYNRRDTNVFLKIALTSGLAASILFLSPFVLIEQGLIQLGKPFRAMMDKVANTIENTENSGSPEETISTSHLVMSTKLKLHEIKNTLKQPEDIVSNFEEALDEQPNEVVVLSKEDFDKVNRYIIDNATTKKDRKLAKRFQMCCEKSLIRANKVTHEAIINPPEDESTPEPDLSNNPPREESHPNSQQSDIKLGR